MEDAILARTAEVRKMEAYMGFLEWVIWEHLHNRRVEMLFGSSVTELLAWFAPDLGRADSTSPWETAALVAAVRATARPGG